MILEFIASGLVNLVDVLINLLPAGTSWSPDISAASSFLGSLYAADAYLPITEAFTCMTIAIAVLGARQALTIAMFLYRRIRG